MPRFVLLEHDHPQRHWDLLLEAGDVLRSWRLSTPPGTAAFAIEPLADHRRFYLDYEGPVSGGRGSVRRWDAGIFEWLEDGPDCVRVRLSGHCYRGILALEGRSGTWLAIEPEAAPPR